AEWPHEVKVTVVGKPFSRGEMLTIRRLGLTERVIPLGELSDGQLARVYRKSLGFVFPSMQEGFGFPSLEAQCCGTPVLCSDIPEFREVAGEAAIYFDPRIAESIAAAVRKVLVPTVSDQLRELGKQNVKRFTWDGCARQSVAAFQEATG